MHRERQQAQRKWQNTQLGEQQALLESQSTFQRQQLAAQEKLLKAQQAFQSKYLLRVGVMAVATCVAAAAAIGVPFILAWLQGPGK